MSAPDVKEIALRMSAECLGFRTRSLMRSVSRIYDDALRAHAVTVAQYGLLAAIALHQRVQPSDLARRLNLEKSTLSRNIRLMEAQGWVDSSVGDVPGTQELRLTRSGRHVLRAAFPAWERAQEEAESFLGTRAVQALQSQGPTG